MSALVMNDDSPRTPLAAVLSVLLHGAVVAAVVAYFWLHVSTRTPSPYVFELFAPPLAATDSPDPASAQTTPATNLTLPNLANLPSTEITLPTETTPPVPTPPTSTPPTPSPPTPPAPATRATTAPARNTRSTQQTTIEEFQRANQRSTRSPSTRQSTPNRAARSIPAVGINATAIANGVRGVGGSTRGTRDGAARGQAQYNGYLARLVALLRAAFELPPGASGLTATVEITIAANGRVVSRTITRKSGNDVFDAAVRDALNSLTFVDPPPSGRQEAFAFIFQPDK